MGERMVKTIFMSTMIMMTKTSMKITMKIMMKTILKTIMNMMACMQY